MAPVLILTTFLTMTYQIEKPCDDTCFAVKIRREIKSSIKYESKEDNSWRYKNENIRQYFVGGYIE